MKCVGRFFGLLVLILMVLSVAHSYADESYQIEWWWIQHRIYENGTNLNAAAFAMKDIDDNYLLDDVVDTIVMFDPNGVAVPLSAGSGFGGVYKTLNGQYNADDGQWYYDEAMRQESWYWVGLEAALIPGFYHLQVTDIDGAIHDAYTYCNGPQPDLPVISIDSAHAYRDADGNFYCSWNIPDDLFHLTASTSVRAWVTAVTDGVNLCEGEVWVKIPTHLGKLFIPNAVFQQLEMAGNGFHFGLHLRTNDNANRSYPDGIELNILNAPPSRGDLDRDGDVDGDDLNAFSLDFGAAPED